jgi:hypothetical protein
MIQSPLKKSENSIKNENYDNYHQDNQVDQQSTQQSIIKIEKPTKKINSKPLTEKLTDTQTKQDISQNSPSENSITPQQKTSPKTSGGLANKIKSIGYE